MGNKDLNSLQEVILPMRFLKTNDVVISSKACEISMLLFPWVVRKQWSQEALSHPGDPRSPLVFQEMHLYFGPNGLAALLVVEEHHVIVADKKSASRAIPACVFMRQWIATRVNESSWWSQRPPEVQRQHGQTSRGAERGGSAANHTEFAGVLCLPQYGLTFAKPNDRMEVASQGVVWTAALCLSDFPFTRDK